MKIAIVSDDEKTISLHFGRTRGFLIYQVVENKVVEQEYRLNTFTGHASGMAGHGQGMDKHGAIINALKDCQVIISHGMGRRIYDDLCQAGIEVYITEEQDAQKALDLYIQGQLVNRPELGCDHGKH
jgi:predicted Fe-Mo cluster-binding NifX family protein